MVSSNSFIVQNFVNVCSENFMSYGSHILVKKRFFNNYYFYAALDFKYHRKQTKAVLTSEEKLALVVFI